MQTLDCVSGLHNIIVSNSPNSPSCLDEATVCKHEKSPHNMITSTLED